MPRPDRAGVLYLSPSQWASLTGCEARWDRNRQASEHGEEPETWQMKLGTALGEAQEALYRGRDPYPVIDILAATGGWEPGFRVQHPYGLAKWLINRYIAWHNFKRQDRIEMWTTEVPFDQEILPYVNMRGYLDGIGMYVNPEKPELNGLSVIEFKSSGKWDRYWNLHNEPATWIYGRAMQTLGSPIRNIIFDYTLTTFYKTPQPVEKSFKRLVIPWSDELADHYMEKARRMAQRALAISLGLSEAVEHITSNCRYCPHYIPCLRPGSLSEHNVYRLEG